MGPFCRLMDTISLMQQLLPHLASQQQQLQGTTAAAASGSAFATTSSTPLQNTHFSSPSSSSSSNSNGILPFGFMKISPTTTVIDANCGLPTAAEASPPSHHHQSLMSFISKTEAALPPEAASTSYSGGACMPPSHNLVQSYMAAVHAAAALQSDAFHSAFRTPFPSSSSSSQPSPSSSSMPPPPSTAASIPPTTTTPTSTPTSSDSFLTLALNTLVSSSDSTNDSKDDSKSSFDGTNRGALLCVVCSDTASGFHYGVFACEGCKGFFRRSIQNKIKYRPCSKFQQCAIVRNNRNRCQDCRLKKCNSVGMSRDAVRFGRVPKREKVKMVEEMQRATIRSLMDSMTAELEDEQALISSAEWGFQEFGNSLKKEMNIGNLQNSCNFNSNNNNNNLNEQMQQLLKSFSAAINGGNTNFDGFLQSSSGSSSGCPVTKTDSYLILLKSVVQFSESIRGFQFLLKEDKVKLLKNSIFPVLLLRLASIKTSESEYLFSIQKYGMLLQDSSFHSMNSNGKLNSEIINDFISRLRSLNLDEKQMALFTALVITQSDSAAVSGCNMAAGFEAATTSQTNLIKLLQDKLWTVLRKTFFNSNAIDLTIKIQSMFSLLTDLKRINEMHEIRLKSFSFIGQQLPSPPITASSTSMAVPMPTSIANLASSIITKKEPTEAKPMVVEGMPTLRKALEIPSQIDSSSSSPPTTTTSSSLSPKMMTNGTIRRSVCDRHPAVASLLSRPPNSTPKPSINSTTIVKTECMNDISHCNNNRDIEMKDEAISKSNEIKIKSEIGESYGDNNSGFEEEDDEMPLNLCIRDNKILS